MKYDFIEHIDFKLFNDFAIKEPDDNSGYITSNNRTSNRNDAVKSSKNTEDITKRADTDGAWKYALEILFFEFLQLFVPDVYDLIDRDIDPESKETELNELLINSKNTKRIVDKLVKVRFKDGGDAYLLIHIEVQSQVKTYNQQLNFAARMYEYHKMLSSKFAEYKHINIGVLINSSGAAIYSPNKSKLSTQADHIKNNHKPIFSLESTRHQNLDYLIYKIKNVLIQETIFIFPVVHLAKWLEHEDKLKALAHSNSFAIIVLYQLVALKHTTKRIRNNAKIELIALTRKYNYTNKLLRELIYLIDMMIVLPENLNIEFYNEVKTMEAEVQERFVSIFERMGKREGLVEGKIDMLLSQLNYKFKSVPEEVIEIIKSASIDQLEKWSLKLFDAQTIDDIFKN